METDPQASDAGYSPALSAELILHGERFDVVSLGPDRVAVRSAKTLGPGVGEIRMVVDGRPFVHVVEFSNGIDAKRQEQAFTLLQPGVVAA
jgi:hypothetical protein